MSAVAPMRTAAARDEHDFEDNFLSESAASSEEEEGSDQSEAENPAKALQTYWYESTARIRMAFFAFNSLATLWAFSMSYIAYVFFEVMGSRELSLPMACSLHVLPVMLFVAATLVDEMVDVALDGMAFPSLATFRATLVTSVRACFPGFTARGAEILILASFEGLPLVSTAIHLILKGSSTSLRGLVTAYCLGGFVFVFISVLVYIVVHVHVARSPRLEADMIEVHKKLDHLGCLTPVAAEDDRRKKPASAPRCPRAAKLLLAALGVQAFSFLLTLLVGGDLRIQITIVGQLVVVILGAMAVNAYVPGLLGRAFVVTLGIFVALTVMLWVGAVRQAKEGGEVRQPLCLGPLAMGYGQGPGALPVTFTPHLNGEGYGYPVCSGHWGNRNMTAENQLNVLDLAALAFASYLPSEPLVADRLGTMFNGTALQSWRLVEVEDASTVGRWIVVDFPAQKVRVIAVRGTSNKADAFADLELYARVTVFQLMDRFTPVMTFLGSDYLRMFMKVNVVSKLFRMQGFWERFLGVVAERKREALEEGLSVVITGHSLGGALAGAAAAKDRIQGVGFSPPGLYYQTSRLGISQEDLLHTFTEIQPTGDVVPRVDVQRGAVNWIQCKVAPGMCHHLTKTSCELWARCGDPRGRDWRKTCREWYGREDLNM